MTRDPDTFALIKGFKISFLGKPVQDYVARIPKMSKGKRELVQSEIQTMMRKGEISRIDHTGSSDKFEDSKFLCALRALKNGQSELTPISPQENRLYGQAGFEAR